MPDSVKSASPFAPPAGGKSAGANAASTVVALLVIASGLFVVASLTRGLLGPAPEAANPAPPAATPPMASASAAPAPGAAWMAALKDLLRPVGVLSETEWSVESGIFSDTLVCAGTVTNKGGGGRLVVRVETAYEDESRQTERGEQDIPVLNAGSSAAFRIELAVPNARKYPPEVIFRVEAP